MRTHTLFVTEGDNLTLMRLVHVVLLFTDITHNSMSEQNATYLQCKKSLKIPKGNHNL